MKTKSPGKNRTLNFKTGWDYAPAPESADHIQLKSQYELFINGEFVAPAAGKNFNSVNPAKETIIARVAEATQPDVDKAVKASRNAYDKTWSKMPAAERGK